MKYYTVKPIKNGSMQLSNIYRMERTMEEWGIAIDTTIIIVELAHLRRN